MAPDLFLIFFFFFFLSKENAVLYYYYYYYYYYRQSKSLKITLLTGIFSSQTGFGMIIIQRNAGTETLKY